MACRVCTDGLEIGEVVNFPDPRAVCADCGISFAVPAGTARYMGVFPMGGVPKHRFRYQHRIECPECHKTARTVHIPCRDHDGLADEFFALKDLPEFACIGENKEEPAARTGSS